MAALVQANAIVFEVHDNYQKQTYRNRCYIAHSNGKLTLNIPIKHAKDGKRQKTAEVIPEANFPWQSQHWKSLQSAYRTSPFFEFYEDDLKPLFEKRVASLLEHNINTIALLFELLGTELQYTTTTQYFKDPPQKDLRHLVAAKKEQHFQIPAYTQVLEAHHGFLNNLSTLDLLFNQGPSALSYLEALTLDF